MQSTVPTQTVSAEAVPLEVRPPRWWTLGIWAILWSVVAYVFYRPSSSVINWYTTIVWTLPFGVGVIGLTGALLSRPIIRRQPLTQADVDMVDSPLHVVITTKGEDRVLGALTRVIQSTSHFGTHFRDYVVHIVVDEGCEALDAIRVLAQEIGAEFVVVPKSYQAVNGARFKARAAQYGLEQLIKRFGGLFSIPVNAFTYHLDDDTSVEGCTVRKIAQFILDNPTMDDKHLAQGILAYRRANSTNLLMWLADAIRTADDLFRFPLTTATGTPWAGLHGENLLIRTCIEALIGWDFGRNEIVEDSRFALTFAERYPGRSAWISARVFGAPPTTAADFVRQRGRWAEGMMALAFNGDIPLKDRLLILHNMIVWATGIFQPVLVVAGVSFMVGDFNVAPITPWLAPLWVISVAYTYWAYWEGLRQNALASGRKTPKLFHRLVLIPGIAYFSLLEGFAGTYGALRFFTRRDRTFVGIAKPL